MVDSRIGWRPVWAALGVVGVLASGCGGDNTAPETVASVSVASPLGNLLDVGGSTQLTATAKDAQGAGMSGVSFSWNSSNSSVISVGATGQIEALAVGSATIQATGGGVSGSLALTVVDADLAGISALVADPYVVALVGATSSDVKTALQGAIAQCSSSAQQGALQDIEECIATARTEASNATDPTDQALLAVLSLFVDQVERLLHV